MSIYILIKKAYSIIKLKQRVRVSTTEFMRENFNYSN